MATGIYGRCTYIVISASFAIMLVNTKCKITVQKVFSLFPTDVTIM
jgi:hypothetical protein